ncbi:hypothetical protein O6H91_17G088500 [Diphasiastrum complanatum]|uniref:Uncharacterized protein n=1 Tax=Diphasiastrum complanatum TaxID=34168 RepID=A0ACC2B901_DIPCM|nr:hypothetical protein O6H91_17G088500 [Diphasiastrum complanatum]
MQRHVSVKPMQLLQVELVAAQPPGPSSQLHLDWECCCSGRNMTNVSVNENVGDYNFFGLNAPVAADNCDKSVNGGVCNCQKKSRMETVSGENCEKCASVGVCESGKKSTTLAVAEDNCDKCANGGSYNSDKN